MIRRLAAKTLKKISNKETIANLDTSMRTSQSQLLGAITELKLCVSALNMQGVADYLEKIYSRDLDKSSIFILSTHEWGNIGDLAIGYSELYFLEKTFPGHNIFTISRLTLLSNWQRFTSTIKDNDIIVIPGGGNMGDIWPHEENARRKIVEFFKGNTIISFPQSIKFYDEKELQKSAKIYSSHKHLLIATRDDPSFELAKTHFKGSRIVRTEDIVMSYEYPAADLPQREEILFVTRNDREKQSGDGVERVKELIENKIPYHDTDTVMSDFEFVSTEFGAKLVYQKVDEMHAARLVVTDRLHGAILALQAGKPVIVFENSYGKIGAALKNVSKQLGERILFTDKNASDISSEAIQNLYTLPPTSLTPSALLQEEFDKFTDEIKRFVK